MKKSYTVLICFSILSGIGYLSSHTDPFASTEDLAESLYCDPIDWNQSATAIQKITAQELAKCYKLSPCGFGGSGMVTHESIMLAFETNDIYTIPEARILLVNCAKRFAANVNTYKPIRPYLTEYPFPISRVAVEIYCRGEQNDANPKNLRRFSISDGKIKYHLVRPKDITTKNSYDPGISESYVDALAIVTQAEKLWSPQITESTDSKAITKTVSERRSHIKQRRLSPDYLSTKYHSIPDAELDATLDTYGEEVAEKYDLLFHRIGNFLEKGEEDLQNTFYGLSFQSDKRLTQEEARLLATTLFRNFYQKMRTDPTVARYHADLNNDFKRYKYPPLITPEPNLHQICWKLAFWDKNVDRPEQPYIAEIQFKNAAFHYYVADPSTHALKLIFEEPYDDAIKHLDQQSSAPSK